MIEHSDSCEIIKPKTLKKVDPNRSPVSSQKACPQVKVTSGF